MVVAVVVGVVVAVVVGGVAVVGCVAVDAVVGGTAAVVAGGVAVVADGMAGVAGVACFDVDAAELVGVAAAFDGAYAKGYCVGGNCC